MSESVHELRRALVARLLTGPGTASTEARRAAFDLQPRDRRTDALLDRVRREPWTVCDADVAAPLEAGLSEDQVFELVVCAAVGQATRQLESALDTLDRATREDGGTSCG
jgi:alkylhydroperoxidase family enzyme